MIRSFRCKHTQALYEGRIPARFRHISAAALRKLDMLDAAACLDDLRIPPGNRLEALRGDRAGQYSIRKERFAFEKGETRGGGTAPPGPM